MTPVELTHSEQSLLVLMAKVQEQGRPEHTYKAVMHRVNSLGTIKEKCALLRELLEEWERSLAVDADAGKGE